MRKILLAFCLFAGTLSVFAENDDEEQEQDGCCYVTECGTMGTTVGEEFFDGDEEALIEYMVELVEAECGEPNTHFSFWCP